MEVKALETLIRLLQGDEDGASDELPEQVSGERTSGCEMRFPPIILDLFVVAKNDFEKHLSNKINERKATASCHHC